MTLFLFLKFIWVCCFLFLTNTSTGLMAIKLLFIHSTTVHWTSYMHLGKQTLLKESVPSRVFPSGPVVRILYLHCLYKWKFTSPSQSKTDAPLLGRKGRAESSSVSALSQLPPKIILMLKWHILIPFNVDCGFLFFLLVYYLLQSTHVSFSAIRWPAP